MPNVAVDIWHCDALGEYSGYGPDAQGAPGHLDPVNAQRFFGGTQITDDQGLLAFRTIVPGWYSGRAVHIHVKPGQHLESDEGAATVDAQPCRCGLPRQFHGGHCRLRPVVGLRVTPIGQFA